MVLGDERHPKREKTGLHVTNDLIPYDLYHAKVAYNISRNKEKRDEKKGTKMTKQTNASRLANAISKIGQVFDSKAIRTVFGNKPATFWSVKVATWAWHKMARPWYNGKRWEEIA